MSVIRRPLLRVLVGLFCLSVMASCSENSSVTDTGTARLSVNVSIDNTFTYPDGTIVGATDFSAPAPADVSMAIRSLAGDYSHVWTSFGDFPQDGIYYVGTYYIEAFHGYASEGFDNPYYLAEDKVDLLPGDVTTAELTLRPVSTANMVHFTPAVLDYFSSVRAYLHAVGGGYFDYLPSDDGVLYLLPGTTSLYLELTLPDGTLAGYKAAELTDAKSGVLYDYTIDLAVSPDGIPEVSCTVSGQTSCRLLDDAFLASPPPVITPLGWNPGETYVLPEGESPSEPVKVSVRGASPIARIVMTVNSQSFNSIGVPEQCDLLNLEPAQKSLLESLGLKIGGSSDAIEIDFTDFLGHLVFLNDAQALTTIGLLARDNDDRVGIPVMATIRTVPMDITVTSVPSVMVGVKEADITVTTLANDFGSNVAIELLDDVGHWHPTSIISVEPTGDDVNSGTYNVRFVIPEGNSGITARILYCNEVRGDFVMSRYMPDFTLEVDAFATYGCIRVNAADEELRAMVVRGLRPYLNGAPASVLARYPDRGIVVITNLTPSTSYTLTSTMMGEPGSDDFTPSQRFSTESTPSLPNAEFEDRKNGIEYDNLPCGGRYSQTTVAIFNWQNHRSYDQRVPKEWANTNAKTFCRHSSNHNTWYMQPSVFTVNAETDETSFAVCLQSVAFDLNGPIIPDYTQTGQPYLKYSPIVPEIASRAAGKLFLGSYSFDPATMQETYRDVVDWNSRPTSLNGYYKYNPSSSDPSDTGLAIIEVYGEIDGRRVVIGSATAHLPVANGYTAFKASVTYEHFGVKAKGLKVMFSSSSAIGTIAEETAGVITTPDPVEGVSLGSILWLDHVTLAY